MEDKELLWALKNGDLDEVKTRLVTVEDVNRTMVNGRKPLHIAADYGQAELIEFLCSLGADVNASDRHGMTPLICACFEDHVACVKVLLEKGADKGQKTPDGRCAFDCAENADIKALLQ